MRRYYERERPIELRPVEFERYVGKKLEGDRFNIWIRTTAPLPDDPAIHRCVLAYASDMTLLDTALVPHGRSVFDRRHHGREPRPRAVVSPAVPRRRVAALRAGQPQHCTAPAASARGLIFAADGTLVASVAQEGLLRERRRRRPEARLTSALIAQRRLSPADKAINPLNL